MEGVVPTTNEITFLRYAELDAKEQQRCERLPDGQNICYLPAEILKKVGGLDFILLLLLIGLYVHSF